MEGGFGRLSFLPGKMAQRLPARRDAIKRGGPALRPHSQRRGRRRNQPQIRSWVLRPTLNLGLRSLHRNYLQEAAPRPTGGAAVSIEPTKGVGLVCQCGGSTSR